MRRLAFLGLCLGFAAVFFGLGVWQLERLQWKLALIERVDARLAAAPQDPPAWESWSAGNAYTRVHVTGVFLHDRETLVQAVTELGPGFWLMTPLRTDHGLVFINRGFVPADLRATRAWSHPEGDVKVTGLLRASEPHGAFLRENAPAAGRWYSRDVQEMSRALDLPGPVAPYFIDADAADSRGNYPLGGLTIVRFRNSHLAYALTWFALAALALGGAIVVGRRRGQADS